MIRGGGHGPTHRSVGYLSKFSLDFPDSFFGTMPTVPTLKLRLWPQQKRALQPSDLKSLTRPSISAATNRNTVAFGALPARLQYAGLSAMPHTSSEGAFIKFDAMKGPQTGQYHWPTSPLVTALISAIGFISALRAMRQLPLSGFSSVPNEEAGLLSPQAILILAGEHATDAKSILEENRQQIIKPDKDTREFDYIVLPNKLEALVISDSEAQKAAVALDCHVGHFSDPDEVPGLAHFCEHMLFLGTKKYPKEGEYKEFLHQHGGTSNAYTAQQHTNYKFEVAADYLEPAMDRFADFFKNPLFTESATLREMNAVDSENKMRLQDDGRRFYQLFKHNSNPDHPMSKFGSGNITTLLHTPLAKGIDVRKQLLDFHDKYYSANNMRVCVVGKEPLPVLRSMVAEKFSGIVSKDVPVPSWENTPFDAVDLPHEVLIRPVKDSRSISMIFPIPWGSTQYWRTKPGGYWSTLLGHEGEGSLLELMKENGWVNTLSAGASYGGDNWSTFSVGMTLTEEGTSHVDELVEMVFAYIKMVKELPPQEWVHHERQKIAQTSFMLRPKGDGYSQAPTLAQNMHYYDPEYVLAGPVTYVEWDPSKVEEFGTHLTPHNMMLYVTNTDLSDDQVGSQEPWYGTPYSKRSLATERLQAWLEPRKWAVLQFPTPNPFVPEDLGILPVTEDQAPFPTEVTAPDEWSGLCRLWHRQDDKFLEPRIVLCLDMLSPAIQNDGIRSHILSYLFDDLVNDDLVKHTYNASVAGLGFSFLKHHAGIQLQVLGYHDKIGALIETIMQSITKDYRNSEERFQVLKERYRRSLANATKDQPLSHASREMDAVLTNVNYSYPEQLEVLEGLQLVDVVQWAEEFFQGLQLRAFIHGNITEAGAVDLLDTTVMRCLLAPLAQGEVFQPQFSGVPTSVRANISLPTLAASSDSIFRRQRVRLPRGTESVRTVVVPNPDDVNSAVVMYFQIGQSDLYRDTAVDVLSQLLQPVFFQKLRTEQQVGYLVSCGVSREYYTTGIQFRIQSNVMHPHDVRARILTFLQTFEEYLQALTEADVQRVAQAMAQKWSEKDKMLAEEASRNWAEIVAEHYFWDRKPIAIQRLLSVTKSEVLQLYHKYLRAPESLACMTILCHSQRFPVDTTKPLADQLQATAAWAGVEVREVVDHTTHKADLGLFEPWVPPMAEVIV